MTYRASYRGKTMVCDGLKLSKLRVSAGYGIRSFARKTGIGRSMISYIERGMRNPSFETAKKISETLKVPVGVLFKEKRVKQGTVRGQLADSRNADFMGG